MPYYCNYNGTGGFTANGLGNLLVGAPKIKVVIKKFSLQGTDTRAVFWQGGSGFSNREFVFRRNGNGNWEIYIGGTATNVCTTAAATAAFGSASLACDEFALEFSGTTTRLFKDGAAVITNSSTGIGTTRLDGALLRFGCQPTTDTPTDTTSGTFAPANSTFGDIQVYINDTLVRNYVTPSTGTSIPDSVGGNSLSQTGTWPANDSEFVPYGNVSVPQDVVVPASKQQDKASVAAIITNQVLTVPTTKQQDVAPTVAIGTNQVLTVPAAKQQDVAPTIAIGTNQVLTVPATKQLDIAPTAAIGTNQVMTVAGSKQQDTAAAVTIGTNQVLTVPATKQQDFAAAVSIAQVAPGSQPITVPAAKQQDVAGVVTVGTSQLITAAGTKQQDKASAISVGQSQIVSVPAIKQQDKAASVTVGTIQTLSVQPVTQTDTAARVVVGATQLVAVPSAQQIDRAAAITLTQQPPITQTIDVRTLRIELTTPRFGVARNTPVYTAQLTTPRYTVARA